MTIKTEKKKTIDGEDYQRISDALELARRYIAIKKENDRRVDEYSPREVANIEQAMDEFWE